MGRVRGNAVRKTGPALGADGVGWQLKKMRRQLAHNFVSAANALASKRWGSGKKPNSIKIQDVPKLSLEPSAKADAAKGSPLDDVALSPDASTHRGEEKIWVVLDVTGTIAAKNGKIHGPGRYTIRPYVKQFIRALNRSGKFRLAVFTSGMRDIALPGLERFQRKAGVTFERILTREHGDPMPPPKDSPWAIVKPLAARGFEDLTRVILIDDSPQKAVFTEKRNMLVVPTWKREPDDQVFKILQEEFLALTGREDVRDEIPRITEKVRSPDSEQVVSDAD
mmetsp:Transcript_3774/g.6633  ORF Transcript_3774/g.6633 Transcript_3774/m.6633 type:complete len:280 (+) Transcript_3774:197-1036(+)